jgi:hypothetical protein
MTVRVVYDAATGRVLSCTFGDVATAEGQAVLDAADMIRPDEWRVDLAAVALVPADTPDPPLGPLQLALAAQVDKEAEATRLLWITPGSGQALTYEQKRAEAERMATDPAPQPEAYPMLAAEVGITADTLADVGAIVRARAAAWTVVAAQIESLRLQAKAAVMAANNAAEARAAAAVQWPAGPSE